MRRLTAASVMLLASMVCLCAQASASAAPTGALRSLAVRFMYDEGEINGGTALDLCKITYLPGEQLTCEQLMQQYKAQAGAEHKLLVAIPSDMAAYTKTIAKIKAAPITQRDGQEALEFVPVEPNGTKSPPSWFYFDKYHGAWRTTGPEGN